MKEIMEKGAPSSAELIQDTLGLSKKELKKWGE
jgi:hypothetical protein